MKPPHVVLLNAGLIHHVGPSRVYVRLARALARRGHAVFRVDLAGVGDSIIREQHDPGDPVDDVRSLLDQAERRLRIADACLVGICSGADNAFDAAQRDSRVVSTVLVNGTLIPRSQFLPLLPLVERRARRRQYRKKLLSPIAWWRLLRGRTGLFRRREHHPLDADMAVQRALARDLESATQSTDPRGAVFSRSNGGSLSSLSNIVTTAWRPLLEHGCSSLLLYSELSSSLDAFRLLMQPFMPRTPFIDVEILRRADHSFILASGQEGLLRAVVHHVSRARDGGASRRAASADRGASSSGR